MLSILTSTLEALIFLFVAALVIGFLWSDFAPKSQSSAQDKGKTATLDK
ncbi:hypothetical protein NIES2100_46700 [Calothrix sp. NIES-2100]|nr:hypothetical protein NIES2100_46700 [Calothrix sp. NIES-2100]